MQLRSEYAPLDIEEQGRAFALWFSRAPLLSTPKASAESHERKPSREGQENNKTEPKRKKEKRKRNIEKRAKPNRERLLEPSS